MEITPSVFRVTNIANLLLKASSQMSSTSLGPRRPPSWMAAVHDDGQMAARTKCLGLFPDACHVPKAQPCISWTWDKWKSRKDYPRITNHGLTFSDSESIHTYDTLIKWSAKPLPDIRIWVDARADISNNYCTSIREYQNLMAILSAQHDFEHWPGLPASMNHHSLHERFQSQGAASTFSWRKAKALFGRHLNLLENHSHCSRSFCPTWHQSPARNPVPLLHLQWQLYARPKRGCTHQLLLTWREKRRLRSWKKQGFFWHSLTTSWHSLASCVWKTHEKYRSCAIAIWTYWWCLSILWHMNILRSYSLPKKLEPRFEGNQIDRWRRLEMEILSFWHGCSFCTDDSILKDQTTLPEARVFLMLQISAYFCFCSSNWTSSPGLRLRTTRNVT